MFQHSTQDDLYRSNDATDERLIKIERSWHKRAQIKLDSQRPDIQLDLQAPDFLEALLPFAHDPHYQHYPHALKLLILAQPQINVSAGYLQVSTRNLYRVQVVFRTFL